MSNEVKVVKKGGIGKFFLGLFLGIVLALGTVFGVGFFAYKKISASFLKKKFGMEVDLGSDKLNRMVLEDLISNAVNVLNNKDTYTLNDLQTNFGIKVADNISGIDISDLKSVGLTNLSDAMKEKIGNISAKEMEEAFSMPDSIKNFEFKYYVNGETLYKDAELKTKIDKNTDFDYIVDKTNNKVLIKNRSFEIDSATKMVKSLHFQYLPLEYALEELSNFNSLTLGDLDQLDFDLPEYFDDVTRDTKLSELGNKIQNMYVGDFLKDYTLEKEGDNVVAVKDGSGNVVTGIIATVAKSKISAVSATVDSLKMKDVFSQEDLDSGILSLLDIESTPENESYETEIKDISTKIKDAVQRNNLRALVDAKIVTCEESDLEKSITIGSTPIPLGDLKLQQIIDYIVLAAV